MSYIPVGYGEVTAILDIPSDAGPANVVFGVEASALGSAASLDSALQAIFPNAGGWTEMYTGDVTLSKAISRYSPSLGVVEVAETAYSLAGQRGGTMAPPQVSTLIQKKTGLAGKSNRGRMYMTPLADNLIDAGGIITEADRLLVQAGATQFLADLAASSCPMVVLHTTAAGTPTPVVALNVETKVATQRRRLR